MPMLDPVVLNEKGFILIESLFDGSELEKIEKSIQFHLNAFGLGGDLRSRQLARNLYENKQLFFHETSHRGTGQFHTHLITEKLPQSLNTQYEMEALFHQRLPHKVKALSKWKSIDIQRINPDEPDYRRISSYLGKQTDLELIAIDPFNSDLLPRKK